MTKTIDIASLKASARPASRYDRQLDRLKRANIDPAPIEAAVGGALRNLANGAKSLVIYGEPQSGKTEMMICLTAKLLDEGHSTIVHLMNDSVDLHGQNLGRFRSSGLAPAPVSFSDLTNVTVKHPELVIFCKKNSRDLQRTIDLLKGRRGILVIDDEADYATPNAKINQQQKTAINSLVGNLIGGDGIYLGVTATPARLDLNSTFDNDAASWVQFPTHGAYTGQDVFFPLEGAAKYRRRLLAGAGGPLETRQALSRFLATAAHLNLGAESEENWTMLVHTSGKKVDHETDRQTIQSMISDLAGASGNEFESAAKDVFGAAQQLYPTADPQKITEYVVSNISRSSLIVLNSKRDRKAAGPDAAVPTSPFTIIVGGNIVSRGVTFPNLISMYFTRDVANRLQQDTYIQRARMFGARGKYLEHFELTIPSALYNDWHRCFVFHRLALETVKSSLGSPVWVGDSRISVASHASINKATVSLKKGEMSFGAFDYAPDVDALILNDQASLDAAEELQKRLGDEAFPPFLLDYLRATAKRVGSLAIHTSSSIANLRGGTDQIAIARKRGFIGKSQREIAKFPTATHHLKVFYNSDHKGKLFYKFHGSVQFIQDQQALPDDDGAD